MTPPQIALQRMSIHFHQHREKTATNLSLLLAWHTSSSCQCGFESAERVKCPSCPFPLHPRSWHFRPVLLAAAATRAPSVGHDGSPRHLQRGTSCPAAVVLRPGGGALLPAPWPGDGARARTVPRQLAPWRCPRSQPRMRQLVPGELRISGCLRTGA